MSIMSGIFMKSSTIPVEPFSTAYLIRDEQNYDYSPSALFSPLDDMPTDFASESVTSPTLENPNDWTSFDSLSSPDVFFKSESLDDSPILTSISPASPLIDHMDLAASALPEDNVSFGGDGNSMAFQDTLTSPLFPSPQLARGQNPPPINRNAVRPEQNVSERSGSKRKSASSSPYSTSSSPRSSTSPPPRPVQHLPPKKTAHNMIEKRYRNNLNDKISALRDAVPALRVMVHRLEAHASPDDDSNNNRCALSPQQFEEDLGGLAPAHKLNKATILSKATEYINHLERKNRALARENQGLRGKVDGLEILVMNGAAGLQRVHQQQPQQWC